MKMLSFVPFRWVVLAVIGGLVSGSARGAVSVTPASGGGSISADTAASAPAPAWTSLGAIVIAEPGSGRGDIGGGTIVLKAPAGFAFDPGTTPSITFAAGDIANASIAVTDSATLTITLNVAGSTTRDTLTIGGTIAVRVRPTAGTPLVAGDIYRPTSGGGTAVILGVTATANTDGSGGTSFGALREVVGAASRLGLQTPPPATATAGAAFSPQPVVLVQDQFGNTRNTANGGADNSTVVNAARGLGTGALGGTTNVTSANGAAAFGSLWHRKAETITVVFSSGSLSNAVSGSIVVNPAPLTVQPDNQARTYGATNPPLTVSYTGFIPGETLQTSGVTGSPVVSTTAQTNSPPGAYPITASVGTLAAQNYTFNFATGVLTVTKAPLTVRANDVVRLYGTANPLFTLAYSGFVLGQDSSVLTGSPGVTTSAGINSPVGSYPIVVTAGTLASPNYSFTFVNGLLSVVPAGGLFADSFTRATDPGPLAPWVVRAGNWSVTGGMLSGGTNALASYGQLYLTNLWDDYSAQALFKMPPGAYGGGLATRLNPATGARYAAWIYPEASPGGANMLKLLKFTNWTDFTLVQQASLPAVGTNWHSLKLVARGNRLAAHFDGNLVASFTDAEQQPYLNGGIGLEFWTHTNVWTLSADDVLVALPDGVVAAGDSYTVREAATLSVSAPGVLGNDTPEMGSLTALLNTGPGHGTLNLTNNGGFTYVPAAGYRGTDTFTYRAGDGSSTSGVATVTITVTTNRAPVAANDSYGLMANTTLSVPAPGVLGNDTDADGDSLTAVLATGPTQGTVSLNPDGSFMYVPTVNYVGSDSFTYRATDGLANSSLRTVSLSVTAFAPWYSDAFTRTNLSPWVVQAGAWALSDGVLLGGTNETDTYGYAYLTNVWSDYTVQARVQFPAGGFGGGVAGRLNPATGARYAAWIYPEGSSGGSRMLRLWKFQTWSQPTLLQQATLPAVGTNWHTLKLAMQGSRIAVHYDGVLRLSAIDSAPQPLTSGGISLELWTGATSWTFTADDVEVNAVRNLLVTNDSYSITMNGTLTVAAPGVLANDVDLDGDPLQALPGSGPDHGILLLSASGGFTYAPAVGYTGADSFTYRASDGLSTTAPATVSLTVIAPGLVFTDDFTRTNPPGALAPWLVRTGNWVAADGILQGGTNSAGTYGQVYLPNSWTDFEAQGRIRLPAGAYGGGLGARLNQATGARYALWIYPEASSGGTNVWKLLKFQAWENFTVMQQGNLAGVGTNWHTLKLGCQGSRIRAYYDEALLASVTDAQPYLSGGVSLELWTAAAGYLMSADDVQVTTLAPDVSVAAVGIGRDLGSGRMNVTFQGASGGLYLVQATTNLSLPGAWLTVSTNLASGDGRWTYSDPASGLVRRFYRATRP